MPCLSGSSRHSVCKSQLCNPLQICECSPRDAFSCNPPVTKKGSSYVGPNMAFARMVFTDIPGPEGFNKEGIIDVISNYGIAGITGGAPLGVTGQWEIIFEKGVFDECLDNLPPTIQLTRCAVGFTGTEGAEFFCEGTTTSSALILIKDADGDPTDFGAVDFLAIQAPSNICR